MKKILIVEDESLVALDISESIASLGYKAVGPASSFDMAVELASNYRPDLILMDICLKGEKDGIEVASVIKAKYDTPVIYITALNSEDDIQRAILTNPSAYLIKPFDIKSLQVAIKIALNHNNGNSVLKGDIIFDDEFSYDSSTKQLILNGEFVGLTKKENSLLELLLDNANSIVDPYIIENHIWPDKDANVNTLRALVSRLRVKLKYKFIETIPSIGYRFTHIK
ncbi:MAG: response regulator [Sulfurospirillum sp.]